MMRRLALAAAALLLLAMAGIAAFIATFDIDSWRPRIIAEAERAAGRSVTIGALGMQGWLSPSITLRDVRLGNLPGGSRPDMLRMARAEMQVSLLALLGGRIVVERLLLDSPDVLLEVVNGTPNWAFDTGPPSGAGPDVAIGELQVRHARLAFAGGPPDGVELVRLSADARGDLRSAGELRWVDAVLRFEGRGGPLARLLGGVGGPLPLSARLEMDGARLSIQGSLREPRGLQGYALDLTGEADAAALRRLALLTGGQGPIPARVAFTARLAGSGFDWPAEQSVRFEMGETALAPGLTLSRTVLEAAGTLAPLRVSVAGMRGADAFTMEGSLGPWRPGAAVPLDLSGSMLDQRLRLAGRVAEPQAGRGIALEATLESPVLGRVSAQVSESGAFFADGIEFAAIRAEGGAFADGRLSISRRGIVGRLALGAVDLDALPAAPAPAPVAAAPARPAARPARLIPDTPITLADLLGTRAELDLAVTRLRLRGEEYRDLTARIALAEHSLRIDPLEVSLPAGRVLLRAAGQQHAQLAQLQVALRGEGLNLARLLPDPPLSGRAELDIDLRGQGETWRSLAASLVGHAGLVVLNGHVDGRLVQGAMPAAMGALAPRIEVACLAARFDVVSGIAQARMLYADSSIGRILGGGRVNLRDETLDLRLNTDLRLPVLNAIGVRVRAPVPVGGTLAAPSLDTATLLGGGATGTVTGLVPGLNQALGVQGMPDCGPPLAIARGGRAGPVPRSLMPAEPAPVQNLLRGLGVR